MSESSQTDEPITAEAKPVRPKTARQPLAALGRLFAGIMRGLTVIFLGALVGVAAFYLLRLMG